MTNKPNTNGKKIHDLELKIGHISSGKIFIISFYDTKGGKMITTSPFNQKTGTDHYNYSHHFDLREGKDIEGLNKRFPTIKPYKELQKEIPGLTETSYTLITIYEFYQLIKSGKMDIKGQNRQGEQIHLKITWTGDELPKPTPKTKKPTNPKGKEKKDDLLDGLEF